jgi:hypothetical protein
MNAPDTVNSNARAATAHVSEMLEATPPRCFVVEPSVSSTPMARHTDGNARNDSCPSSGTPVT